MVDGNFTRSLADLDIVIQVHFVLKELVRKSIAETQVNFLFLPIVCFL
jgi:hypothetical protein